MPRGRGVLALLGLLPAPAVDARVVAREKHLGHAHAAKLGRARVLRAARKLAAERVVLERRRVADDAGDEPADRVDQHHGRDLGAAQYVIADRDLAGAEAGAHAVVDALVAAAHDDQARLAGELGRQRLVEAPAPGLEQDHRPRVVEHHALDRLEYRLRLEDHPRAAAERHVVDLAVPVVREVAQVVRVQLDDPALDRAPDDAVLERRPEHPREDRDDVEPHTSSTSSNQSATVTAPPETSTFTTASRVAGMRNSVASSRETHTSFAGRSRTSWMAPSGLPDVVLTSSPMTSWW